MTTKRTLGLLISLCLALFLQDLTATDLWSSHEARAAQNAQRMIDDGDWSMLRLYDGQADLQKPPAFYWFVAAIAEGRGGTVDRWAVRLPSVIAALITVLSVWHWLVARGRPLAGLIAGVVLASSLHFTSLARTGRIDMSLTAAITASLLWLERSAAGQRPRALLAGLTLALAILLKGPVGLALPLAAMMAWSFRPFAAWNFPPLAASRGLMRPTLVAATIAALAAAPWFVWMNARTNGEFFQVFLWYHNVDRVLGDAPALAVHPWWYYLPRLAIDFLPWTPALIAAVYLYFARPGLRQTEAKILVRRDAESSERSAVGSSPTALRSEDSASRRTSVSLASELPTPNDRQAAFGLIWLVSMVGVLSFAKFKRADYLLPVFPGAAIFVGCVAETWWQALTPRWRRMAAIAFALTATGCLTGWWWFHQKVEPRQQAVREQRAFAAHIRERAPVPHSVLLFRVESHLLAFHLGRPVHTLVEWAELNERLAVPGKHWFVTRAEFVPECLQYVGSRRIEVAARSEAFCPAPPLRPLVLMTTIDEPIPCLNVPPKP